jgi:hypothetical protein
MITRADRAPADEMTQDGISHEALDVAVLKGLNNAYAPHPDHNP